MTGPGAWLRALYDWTMGLAATRHATRALAVVSFLESSVFPIPPDVVLAPMVLARPEKAYVYAGICTVASVLGGILGYAIGYFLSDLGESLLALMGHAGGLETFRAMVRRVGRLGDPDQGRDADPLQARHHRLRSRGLQLPGLRRRLDRDARRAVLPRRVRAEALRPGDPGGRRAAALR